MNIKLNKSIINTSITLNSIIERLKGMNEYINNVHSLELRGHYNRFGDDDDRIPLKVIEDEAKHMAKAKYYVEDINNVLGVIQEKVLTARKTAYKIANDIDMIDVFSRRPFASIEQEVTSLQDNFDVLAEKIEGVDHVPA